MAEFERWGFERIITPLFECADVLERGLGDDARAAAIRFVEPVTGEVVALRPDITPQAARLVVTRMADIEGPIRLCYEGRVARLSAGARGQRELLQAGVELYGAPSPDGDIEAVSLAASALASTGMPGAHLEIGHVVITRHVLEQIDDGELRAQLELALRKKDRAAAERLSAALPKRLRQVAGALPTLYGDPRRVFRRLADMPLPAGCRRALGHLEEVVLATGKRVMDALGSPLSIELGEVRGFDYYTGLRLAGYAPGAGGAVLLGGRYDQLAARYGRSLAAVGFAVDIEAVAEAQTAAGRDRPVAPRGVLVVAPRNRRADADKLAEGLRRSGWRAAVDLGRSRARAEVRDYARHTGFTSVLELGPHGASFAHGAGEQPLARAALKRIQGGDTSDLLEGSR